MLTELLVGLPVMLICLVLQAAFAALCMTFYLRYNRGHSGASGFLRSSLLLSMVMLTMLLSNFLQMVLWAGLFRLLGEFDSASAALYFSGVTFATLGYGDVVLSPEWRLLGPLEAANGILMFGVSTAVMTAAVMDVLKRNLAAQRLEQRQAD